jgi:hypothetical protein
LANETEFTTQTGNWQMGLPHKPEIGKWVYHTKVKPVTRIQKFFRGNWQMGLPHVLRGFFEARSFGGVSFTRVERRPWQSSSPE